VGEWVLFMHSTIIWVYGCHESPYLLPVFITPRIFSLEFTRERIISETEHFLKLHQYSNLKFHFIIGPFIFKHRSFLSQVQENLKDFGFAQLQGRGYDPHQIISKRILMNKQAPYEHEKVEDFDKLENLQFCVYMEAIMKPIQTQQVEATLQQSQIKQTSQKLANKVPKISVYIKRRILEAMGISDQQNAPKKMKFPHPTHIVDLEEEEPREKVNLDMVESGNNTIEVKKERKIQSEGGSRTFISKKYIFDKKI